MAQLADIVIDCSHPAVVARFWAQALDGYAVAPYDDEELARLRSIGIEDPADDPTVLVEGPPGAPRLWFQQVPEVKAGKNRVHLDLRTDHLEAEVARLISLGARVLSSARDGLTMMADVEANEFCVTTD
jgi:hypothetical protein